MPGHGLPKLSLPKAGSAERSEMRSGALPVLVLSQYIDQLYAHELPRGRGRSTAAVAGALFISESAVAKHTAAISTGLRIEPSADDNRSVPAVLAYLKR
ncbi:hypothetical protein [Streptomyces virginiae]|uniref:hypothetical protein n=1 Tax=Streptomyces virginiae TaxID=1961 RepID=UPI0036FED5A5